MSWGKTVYKPMLNALFTAVIAKWIHATHTRVMHFSRLTKDVS
jgi:hypothetical protein